MKKTELEQYWINLIKPIFPKHAEMKPLPSDGIILITNWLLNNNDDRPKKRSKTIHIIIPQEVIEDHGISVDSKLKSFVKNKYSIFNPEHNKEAYESGSSEEFVGGFRFR